MSSIHEENPNPKQRFTGYWIPVELSRMDLSKIEQFLLSMIDSLEEDAPNYCFASNAYLAEKMELSESRVSFYLTKFKRMGLIEEVGFNGRRRRIRTCKENWFRKNDDFSKKELCVNSRRQTTRSRECSMRDSTNHIIKEIEKKIIDDDDRVREAEKKKPEKEVSKNESQDVVKINTKGQEIRCSQSEIFRHFVGKTYSSENIKEAIRRTQSASGPINNILKYIESICQEIESQNAKESVPKKSKEKENPERKIIPRQKPSKSWDQVMEEIQKEKQNKGK